ncbi:Uncharacterized protein SCG7086_BH_00030 [Chlamydiales bacterium SCGC AG-110-P3]|nr:Uncharacterized protein SCG7086_BH_00030 [Chlamydiales bacterium SCGC AG-110-P3]
MYEAVSYWDKSKKQSQNRQVCIGKLDSVSGEFIPSKRTAPDHPAFKAPTITASAEIVGPSTVLEATSKQPELSKLLKLSFPEAYPVSPKNFQSMALTTSSLKNLEHQVAIPKT